MSLAGNGDESRAAYCVIRYMNAIQNRENCSMQSSTSQKVLLCPHIDHSQQYKNNRWRDRRVKSTMKSRGCQEFHKEACFNYLMTFIIDQHETGGYTLLQEKWLNFRVFPKIPKRRQTLCKVWRRFFSVLPQIALNLPLHKVGWDLAYRISPGNRK